MRHNASALIEWGREGGQNHPGEQQLGFKRRGSAAAPNFSSIYWSARQCSQRSDKGNWHADGAYDGPRIDCANLHINVQVPR
jgi:hypothetical protein